jgi:general stress protein 26
LLARFLPRVIHPAAERRRICTTANAEERMANDLDKLYEHIADIEVAMMTTRRADGHLQSRAMATQKRVAGADLWFVTLDGTAKIRDLAADPHVNLAYYKDRTREWVSVSGIVALTRDRQKIHELYAPDWKAWFPKGDDPRHGTADDPRMVLLGVTVHAAMFLEVNKPEPIVLFELVKGWVTGSTPELGEMHRIEK